MNIWQIKKLKEELANNTISQSNLFFYYLIVGISVALLVTPNFNYYEDYQEVSSQLIELGITTFFYLLGLFFCYKANKGNLGKNFIDKIVSLEVVLTIRYVIFLYLPLTFLWVVFFDGGIYSDYIQIFNSIVYEIVVTLRVIFCIKEVANQK